MKETHVLFFKLFRHFRQKIHYIQVLQPPYLAVGRTKYQLQHNDILDTHYVAPLEYFIDDIWKGPNDKLLPLPQPPMRARTDTRTNTSAQRATQLRRVLARVYAVSIQNQITSTFP
jgi:hypothetical protein